MGKMIHLFFVGSLLSASMAYFTGCGPAEVPRGDRVDNAISATQSRPAKVAPVADAVAAEGGKVKDKVADTKKVVAEIPTSTPINAATFDEKVLRGKGIIVVDFWAPWCGPCVRTGPEMEKVAVALGDTGKVYKVNVDNEQQLAQEFNVISIPTLLIFKDGKQVGKNVGYIDSVRMLKIIDGVK
ncbi:MAG: thioredoxin [bacterium]